MKNVFLFITVLFFSTSLFSQERFQFNGQVYLKVSQRYNAQTDFEGNPLPAFGNIPKINVIECIYERCNIDGYLFLKNGSNFIGQSDFEGNRTRYYRRY